LTICFTVYDIFEALTTYWYKKYNQIYDKAVILNLFPTVTHYHSGWRHSYREAFAHKM